MSTTVLPLFAPTVLTAAAVALYTATAKTRIDALTVSNPSVDTAYTLTVYWVPKGGSAADGNSIVCARSILPGESWNVLPFIGQTLGVGDSLQAKASTADKLNLFGSGTQLSW